MNSRTLLTILGTLATLLLAAPADEKPRPTSPKPAVPPGVNAAQTSDDPKYGFTKEQAIKVGSKEEFGGPKAEREYLSRLRDEKGNPVNFERTGSVGPGPDRHVLDLYVITTGDGKTHELYLDMYHPENAPAKQKAPKGFFMAK